jgi:hypothetical protein
MMTAMSKPAFTRDKDDLRILLYVVALIPMFQKYSPHVQTELGRSLHIQSFGKDRVLLQQGLLLNELRFLSIIFLSSILFIFLSIFVQIIDSIFCIRIP